MEVTQMTNAEALMEVSARHANELADGYVGLWNEPDAERRRELIGGLFAEDAVHMVQPPDEVRQAAAGPGLGLTAVFEARGRAEIEARAKSAYEHWVNAEGMTFRRQDDVDRVGDVVKFHWEAVA